MHVQCTWYTAMRIREGLREREREREGNCMETEEGVQRLGERECEKEAPVPFISMAKKTTSCTAPWLDSRS